MIFHSFKWGAAISQGKALASQGTSETYRWLTSPIICTVIVIHTTALTHNSLHIYNSLNTLHTLHTHNSLHTQHTHTHNSLHTHTHTHCTHCTLTLTVHTQIKQPQSVTSLFEGNEYAKIFFLLTCFISYYFSLRHFF